MNFRVTQTDRRYLDDTEKEAFDASGAGGRQQQALGRAKAFRASENYRQNAPIRTTDRAPGGGFGGGSTLSALRGAEKREEDARAEGFRPDLPSTRVEDPRY